MDLLWSSGLQMTPQPEIRNPPDTSAQSRSPVRFCLLTYMLSVPFLLLGAATSLQLLAGIPVSAFAFVCPGMAAAILVYEESKSAGVLELLKRALDYSRIRAKIWYVPVTLLMPAISLLTYGIMRLTGMPIPGPQFSLPAVLAMFLAFCLAALAEELGWSGYVIDPLQERWGCAESQRSGGRCLGRLALRAADTGSPIDNVDCLVVTLHGGATSADRLALQQHRP